MAGWTFPGATIPPEPEASLIGDGVSFANASASVTGAGTQSMVAGVSTNAWSLNDVWVNTPGAPGVVSGPYFEFSVDSSNYGGVAIDLSYALLAKWRLGCQ